MNTGRDILSFFNVSTLLHFP
uniref:Uncharacterized protein n=1 Tax=Anguilla anguilla TaxID=7936 RepID=A0A0E9TNL1_ANGAN